MQLFNTLTRKLENFEPANEQVTMYVCGITPYDTTHLGHAFTYTSADILLRFLESRGYSVLYAQNVTDIDDDILRKSRETGEDWREVGNRWTAHFIQDMISLNVRPPDFYPRATEVIPDIISSVESLLASGVAYESAGNVYFSVDNWQAFGRLSRLNREEMLPIANERGNHPDDPHKRHPLDFVLWQAQVEEEPAWDSPWGPGRPGWHIECSTMATMYLGSPIDIHGGGADLCFPHHECEIAQFEPISSERPFVRFWMHAAMVYHAGAKMSKSLGNLVMVRDLIKKYSPDALRLYLGSHHYREPWTHSEDELDQAQKWADLLAAAVTVRSASGPAVDPEPRRQEFLRAMENDLDTRTAVAVMVELAQQVIISAEEHRSVAEAQRSLVEMSAIFGLRLGSSPDPRVISGWNTHLQRFPVKAAETK